jgi:hypothetical protein
MSDALLATLLPAIDIAAFSRSASGSFSAVAPPPPWFARLADVTFPFLGHILEEANQFWRSGAPGWREFGPCEEVDESGRQFHYRVKALTVGANGKQFLIFQLDPGSDHLRNALQKAREQTLAVDQRRTTHDRTAAEVRRTGAEILQLLEQLGATVPTDAQTELLEALRARCDALMKSADRMAD